MHILIDILGWIGTFLYPVYCTQVVWLAQIWMGKKLTLAR